MPMTEDDLKKKVGTENPFRVPDGYFENFASNLMERLPEKEKVERSREDVGESTAVALYGCDVCRRHVADPSCRLALYAGGYSRTGRGTGGGDGIHQYGDGKLDVGRLFFVCLSDGGRMKN